MSRREFTRSNLPVILAAVIAFSAYFFSFAFVQVETKYLAVVLSAPVFGVQLAAAKWFPDALSSAELAGLAATAQFAAYFIIVILVRAGYRRVTRKDDS